MMDKIEEFMKLPYTYELTQDPDVGWGIRIKELPGCISQGETVEEALRMIKDAQHLWLEVELERGAIIPMPHQEEEFSGKFVVRIPRSLHKKLVEMAEEEGVSLNQIVNYLLASGLQQTFYPLAKSDSLRSVNEQRNASGV